MSPVNPSEIVGYVSPVFINKFGFNPNCRLIAFSAKDQLTMVGSGCYKDN